MIAVGGTETCNSITIDADNLANNIEVGGTVDGNITNNADLGYLSINSESATGATGAKRVTGSIINNGALSDNSVPEIDGDDEDELGDGNSVDDGSGRDEFDYVGLYIGDTTVGGTVSNNANINAFDTGIEIRDSVVGAVTNNGNISSNGWSSYGILSVDSSLPKTHRTTII